MPYSRKEYRQRPEEWFTRRGLLQSISCSGDYFYEEYHIWREWNTIVDGENGGFDPYRSVGAYLLFVLNLIEDHRLSPIH